MIELELSPIAQRVVSTLASVSADEEVLALADAETSSVARSFATAARATGADAHLLFMLKTDSHGNEPTRIATDAMQTADVVFTVTTHSIAHTHARIAAAESGTRIVVVRGVTEELMPDGGINTDYEWLRDTTAAVRDVLGDATSARNRSTGDRCHDGSEQQTSVLAGRLLP